MSPWATDPSVGEAEAEIKPKFNPNGFFNLIWSKYRFLDLRRSSSIRGQPLLYHSLFGGCHPSGPWTPVSNGSSRISCRSVASRF